MALRKRVIDIPIGAGLGEKVDDKLVQPPVLSVAQNVRFPKSGQLRKRYGYTALSTTKLGTPHTILKNQGTLAVVNSGGTPAAGDRPGELVRHANGAWVSPEPLDSDDGEVHPITPCTVTGENLQATSGSILNTDVTVTTTTGFVCYVWVDNGKIYALVKEAATGAIALGPTELTDAGVSMWFAVKVARANNDILVFGHDGTSSLYTWRLNTTTTLAWTASRLYSSSVSMPFAVGNGSGVVWLAHNSGSGLQLASIQVGGTALNTATPGDGCGQCIAILGHTGDGRVYFAFAASGGNATYQVRSQDFSTTHVVSTTIATKTGAQVTQIGLAERAGFSTNCFVAWEESADASHARQVRTDEINGSSPGTGDQTNTPHMRLVAEPFVAVSVNLVPCAYAPPNSDTLQFQGLLLSRYGGGGTTAARQGLVARYLVDRIRNPSITAGTIGHAVQLVSGTWVLSAAAIGGGASSTIAAAAKFTIPGDPLPHVEVEGVTYLGGGTLWAYDGNHVQESSPHYYPEEPTVALAGSGGSIDSGTHSWLVLWEWEDSRGVLHRSAPGPAKSATAAANDSATVTIPDLSVRARDNDHMKDLRFALYRTAAGGSVFFLAKSGKPSDFPGAIVGMLDITDSVADSGLGAQLYTEGGVLQAEAWPPLLDLAVGKGRLIGIDSERPRRLVYSKFLASTVAPEHNAALEKLLPEDGTAVEVFGTAFVAWSATRTFAIFGDGPNDLGQQDSFSAEPEVILNNTGCVNPRSVARCPRGIVFHSARGIELLQPSMTLAEPHIGAAVEDTLGTANIIRTVVVERDSEVHFLLDDGTTLVWNYLFNTWASWTAFSNGQDAILGENGKPTYATNTAVIEQDTTTHKHAGSAYTMKIRTAWIKVGGINGHKRVWRVLFPLTWLDDHDLNVRVGYNYTSTVSLLRKLDQITLPASMKTDYRVRLHLTQQKCQSIRFELDDGGGDATTGESFALSSIGLELGLKRGGGKVPHAYAPGVGE